jgi:hypothetical protein
MGFLESIHREEYPGGMALPSKSSSILWQKRLLLPCLLLVLGVGILFAECEDDGFWHLSKTEEAFRERSLKALGGLLPGASGEWEVTVEQRTKPFRVHCDGALRPELTVRIRKEFHRPVNQKELDEALQRVAPTPAEIQAQKSRREAARQAAVQLEKALSEADFATAENLQRLVTRFSRQGGDWKRLLWKRRQEVARPFQENTRSRIQAEANRTRWHFPKGKSLHIPGATLAFRTHQPPDRDYLVDDLMDGVVLLLGSWEEAVRDERRVLIVPRVRGDGRQHIRSLVIEVFGTTSRVDELVAELDLPHFLERLQDGAREATSGSELSQTLTSLVDRPGDLDLVLEGSGLGPVLQSPSTQDLLIRLGRDLPGGARSTFGRGAYSGARMKKRLDRIREELEMLQEDLKDRFPGPGSARLQRRLGHQIEALRELQEDSPE